MRASTSEGAAPGIRIEGRLVFGEDGGARGAKGGGLVGGLGGGVSGALGTVAGIDLALAPGEWSCLLGPSGIGKSTLLRLIAGLPAGGRLEGRIAASDGRPLEGRLAYMAQSDLLVPWLDVLGNVTLGARLRGEPVDRERAEAMVARVGLSGRAGARPPALSGGQRQRVALARTLMEDRPVALLDEPFSALDARTRAEMQELAFEALAGRTVLIVTHEPAEAVRLGAAVWLMTEAGLESAGLPPGLSSGRPIRDPADPDVLAAGAALLTRLRDPARRVVSERVG